MTKRLIDPERYPTLFLELQCDCGDEPGGAIAEAAFAKRYDTAWMKTCRLLCGEYARVELTDLLGEAADD